MRTQVLINPIFFPTLSNLERFDRDTETLLVTDAVVYVSDNVPDAIPDADLLESGDDESFTIGALKLLNLFDIREKAKSRMRTSADMDVDERLSLGWKRNALQALYFGPSNLLDPDESWARITNRMIVAPVVSTLVYENVPVEVRLFFYFRMVTYGQLVCHRVLFTGATMGETGRALEV